MKTLFFLAFALACPSLGFGQEKPDLQVRLPVHAQIFGAPSTETSGRWGLALWSILPDVTAQGNRVSPLVVAGPLWQRNKNWVEIMGGVRFNRNGFKDPIVNIRFQNTLIPRVSLSGDIQQSFRAAKRRTVYWVALDTPTPLLGLRVGVETENIHFFGKNTSLGLGPRVTYVLPWKLPNGVKTLVAATYQFRNDQDFVRVYLVTNLSLGAK